MADRDFLKMRDGIVTAFEKTLEAMLGSRVTLKAEKIANSLQMEPNSIVRQQGFSILPGPLAWVYAPEETWKTITNSVLIAAGLDSVTEEDQRSTWSETVQQGVSAFASMLTADVRREITAMAGTETVDIPSGPLEWARVACDLGDGQILPIQFAFANELVAVYNPASFTEILDRPPQKENKGSGGAVSKTFDLLLDVALPVSVSFGKTSLQLKEVLKLNTGSIVELDRFVTEPVDVIVNDCVIARGDVVVIDGNYGVRIRQLASREDRMRTGMNDVTSVTARKP